MRYRTRAVRRVTEGWRCLRIPNHECYIIDSKAFVKQTNIAVSSAFRPGQPIRRLSFPLHQSQRRFVPMHICSHGPTAPGPSFKLPPPSAFSLKLTTRMPKWMAYSSWQTDLKNTEYTALASFGEQRYWPPAAILGALIYQIRLALPLREHHPRPKHPRHPSSACTPVASFRGWAVARVGRCRRWTRDEQKEPR